MKLKKFLTKTSVIGVAIGAMLSMGVLVACGDDTESRGGQETGGAEGSGEHGAAGEAGGEGGSGSEEASGTMLAPDETFDTVRAGARLMMRYDAPSNSFTGTVENTTNNVLTRVRIEVHLSNGVELGPTTPVDLAPGEVIAIALPATPEPFTGWTPHAEVGSGEGGGGGEGSESGGEGGGEGPEGSPEGSGAELNEAAMSSPIVPLSQTWEGNLGGLAISARYDAATQTVYSTVENTTSQVLCYVQAEPHLKSGTTTVGELGPDVLGHLSPGQVATTAVAVSSEPSLAGVSFDGYVVHMEIFDCAGSGPVPHTGGEGGEGGGGEGAGGEGHGPGGEGGSEGGGEGSETGSSGGEEGSGDMLALNETFDTVRAGARLILNYDAQSNSFKGTVENTTNNTLTRVRIEVHLSNGTELGPTTPVDMAPGQVLAVNLPATAEPFTGWVPHAEVGSGEGGGEHGSESGGGEGSGEHGSGGEHGGSGEGGGG
ncbi:MAG: hypothetical protein OXS33_04530 [bacterium]|nr:hypothetical protein [bacterium]